MKLAEVVAKITKAAAAGPESGEDRRDWQRRLVDHGFDLLEQGGLTGAAARQWLANVAQTVTANMIKRAGGMPRAAAGQLVAWPELAPVIGLRALRAYAKKYANVVVRRAAVIRFLGYLDAAFEQNEERLAKYATLELALRAAGATDEDIEILRDLSEVA